MVEAATSGSPARVRSVPDLERTLVMGVVNVTPDSFSDGGQWFSDDTAVRHGFDLADEGADIVDVGGESTRPGAGRIDEDEELHRAVPVVRELARAGVFVSIDTMRSGVAEAALDAGARMVNDVSGGLADPRMPYVLAEARVPYVLMHWRGHSRDMQSKAVYDDVVADVTRELGRRVESVVDAGVEPDQLVLDPGLGFAKTAEHNWTLLTHLHRLEELGRPVLLAAARKSFLGDVLATPDGTPRPVTDRDDASVAVAALASAAGVWGIRAHLARPTADAVRVAAAWRAAR